MPMPNHTDPKPTRQRIPWFPLEVVAVVLTGLATCLLAWMEFDRHNYEKKQTEPRVDVEVGGVFKLGEELAGMWPLHDEAQ